MHDIVKGFGWLLVAIGLALTGWGAYSVRPGAVRMALDFFVAGGGVIALGCICWTLGAILEQLTEIRDKSIQTK